MRKETLMVGGLVLLGLIVAPSFVQAEELEIPFSAIKSSCYGKIDMSKAEFDLSEVGQECVTEGWLEENLSEAGDEFTEKAKKLEAANVEVDNPPKSLVAPKSAVIEKWRLGLNDKQKNKAEVEVPVSWIKDSWLEENIPELAESAVSKLLDGQPSIGEVVEIINTPRQLRTFMDHYFEVGTLEDRDGVTAFSPSRMLETKLGNCKDWATFISYVLKWNGYEAQKLIIPTDPMADGHLIPVWKNSKDQYQFLNYRKFYWDAGKTMGEVVRTAEKKFDFIEKIYGYGALDPLTLYVRPTSGAAVAKRALKEVPYAKDLSENELQLGEREEEGAQDNNYCHGRIMKIEKVTGAKYRITYLVDLPKIFKNPSPEYVLIEGVTSRSTNYTTYDWKKRRLVASTLEKVLFVGAKGGVRFKEKIRKIDDLDQFTLTEIWGTS